MASKTRNHRTYTVCNDLYAEVTDRIVAALEQGTAPWVCPWRREGESGRPRNGASGHVYRGINTVLTGMAGFASSRWYTFNQAKRLGGRVRRGEKGTRVVYWKFIQAKTPENGDQEDQVRRIPLLRSYTVFNAEQVGWPDESPHAPGLDDQDPDTHLDEHEAAFTLIEATGADIRHGGDRACYSPSADMIRLPAPGRFAQPGDYYATALHELAHWTGHEARLGRDLTGRFGSESYAAEELVAELAAAFLSADLGIPGQLQHAEYIGSWIKVLRADKRAIFTAARHAQEAADFLAGASAGLDDDEAQNAPGMPQEASR
jgi:antirestriction protein ArdC